MDGTLTSFDPDNMSDKDFSAVRPSRAVIEEFARRVLAAGFEAFFEANAATFATEPAGVERSSLPGTLVVHDVDQMRVDGHLRAGKVCFLSLIHI